MKQPFERVVAEHGATVLRVCRVLLGPHDADDAWSETFLAALRAYPDLPATANVEAWLVTIAHRKAIDVLRAAKRDPLPVDELPEVRVGGGSSAGGRSGTARAAAGAGAGPGAASGPIPPAGSGLLGAPAGSGGPPGTPAAGNALLDDPESELWAAVARLPAKQRQAVAYHHVAGLTYAEIAEIIGGTADAARRAAADGIKNLRKTYPEEERHDGPPSR